MKKIVAVGALGGSGTRAITQVLIEAGVYMGDILNDANDNLLFTSLFKQPGLVSDKNGIFRRFDILSSYMQHNHLSLKQAVRLITYFLQNPLLRKEKINNVPYFILLIKIAIRKNLNKPIDRDIWGWKEPNTQLFIDEMAEYFKDLKYIHVIRHGLDMAFSGNKQQLINWGGLYDIHVTDEDTIDSLAYKQLEYWIRSTKHVLEISKRMGENFMLVNHTDFCIDPVNNIDSILSFVGINVDSGNLDRLYSIPKLPKTLGRYKDHDIGIFDEKQLDFIKEMGFVI